MSQVLVSVESRVATITIDNPERRNALDQKLAGELAEAIERCDSDSDVGAIILTGSGSAFCAGGNLTSLADAARDQSPYAALEARRDAYLEIYAPFLALRSTRLPTIAAVNGPAVGAGLNLALAADVIVAGETAKFVSGFLRIGLHPGGGNTSMLVDRVGPQTAAAMTLFGEVLKGPDAYRLGLAYQCAPDTELLKQAQVLADTAAQYPRSVTVRTKETLRMAGTSDYETVLKAELTAQVWSTTVPETVALLEAASNKEKSDR